MANETVLFKRGDSATITSTPVTDGQILFDTSGNGKMYLDNGTDRLEMGGAITVDASLSNTSTNAIQNKAVTGNILNSLAEVSAATQQNTIAGALALKEVNSSLIASDNLKFRFATDGEGNYGYLGADDSFIPFKKSENVEIITHQLSLDKYGQNTYTFTETIPDGKTCVYVGIKSFNVHAGTAENLSIDGVNFTQSGNLVTVTTSGWMRGSSYANFEICYL